MDLITGTETYPHVNQSTTFSWGNPDNPDQIVVAYNDIRGSGSWRIGIDRRRPDLHPPHQGQRSKPLP